MFQRFLYPKYSLSENAFTTLEACSVWGGGEGYSNACARFCEARFSRKVNKIEGGDVVRAWGVERGRGREMDD